MIKLTKALESYIANTAIAKKLTTDLAIATEKANDDYHKVLLERHINNHEFLPESSLRITEEIIYVDPYKDNYENKMMLVGLFSKLDMFKKSSLIPTIDKLVSVQIKFGEPMFDSCLLTAPKLYTITVDDFISKYKNFSVEDILPAREEPRHVYYIDCCAKLGYEPTTKSSSKYDAHCKRMLTLMREEEAFYKRLSTV